MSARFSIGDKVRVRDAHPPGHIRTPHFIRGKEGTVDAVIGSFANPEELAYGRPGTPEQTLYGIKFSQTALWSDYVGSDRDTAVVDVYEHWLTPLEEEA